MRKHFLFIAAFLTATVMNLSAATVTNVKYIDANGVEQTCAVATVVEDASAAVTWSSSTTGGWYVVTGADVKLTKGAICSGAIHLILADGAQLTATGATSKAGIAVSGDGKSLAIYGQSGQRGDLIATGGGAGKSGGGGAGIGGGSQSPGSNITINGGVITATGGATSDSGAGIGGGGQGPGSNITINGGTVTATSKGGAGIGGGNSDNGSNITINGGVVTATSQDDGAGIGGGSYGDGSNITINGGVVTAIGGSGGGAGIGGGMGDDFEEVGSYGNGSNITIKGGIVTATGGEDGAGIGGGHYGIGSDIFVDPSVPLKADNNESPTTVIPHASITTDIASLLAGKRYAKTEPAAPADTIQYIAPVYNTPNVPTSGILRWDTLSCTDYIVVDNATSQVTWSAGWYVVTGADVKLTKGAICSGAIHLILADGAQLTATVGDFMSSDPGIKVSGDDNSFTIYGQSGQTGSLVASSQYAGIGGGNSSSGSNITINGGVITATGLYGAGIGGGYGGSGSNITINGGVITAEGKYQQMGYLNQGGGAGIGGGLQGDGSNITINGGIVTATSGAGAGIGSGMNSSGSSSNIFVDPSLVVKADNSVTPTTIIPHASITTDVASLLAGQRYATIEPAPTVQLALSVTELDTVATGEEYSTDITYTDPTAVDSIQITKDGVKLPTVTSALNSYSFGAEPDTAVYTFRFFKVGYSDTTITCNVRIRPNAPAPVLPMQIALSVAALDTVYTGVAYSTNITYTAPTAVDSVQITKDGVKLSTVTTALGNYSFGATPDTAVYTFQFFKDGYKDTTITCNVQIRPRFIDMISASATKPFDGQPLTNDTITFSGEGFVGSDTVNCNVTGSQTEVGWSLNNYTYEFVGSNKSNYEIVQSVGMLTVTAAPITGITLTGYDAVYDGQEHAVQVNETEEGDVVEFSTDSATWQSTNPSYTNVVDTLIYVRVQRENYQDWGGKAAIVIAARAITMTSASDTKQFDGDPLTNSNITFSGEGFVGLDTVSCTVTGSRTEVGSSANTFTYTFSGSSEANYAFTKVEGTLEVTAAPTPESVELPEDGDPAAVQANLRQMKEAGTPYNITIKRTFKQNGTDHTICLPFSLTADQLAAGPLAGFNKLQEFSSATIENEGADDETLVLTMTTATAIEAGVPYIIAWPNGGADIKDPVFNGMVVTREVGDTAASSSKVEFIGTFVPTAVVAGDKGIMFVGKQGVLNWPDVGGNIKGFRCYFELDLTPGSPLRRGMNAVFGDGKTTPTGLDNTPFPSGEGWGEAAQKLIKQGRVIIISDGVRYDMNGNIVK